MQLLFLLALLITLLICRIITTTIHEMGHAVPALLFSDQPVTIYVGSYGDPQKSRVFQWGRLTAFFQFDLTKWDMGLCMHRPLQNYLQTLIVVLGGPFASLLFGLGLTFLIVSNDYSNLTIYLLAFFVVSFFWDFLVNIIPTKQPITLHDGNRSFNDGYQFVQLWKTSQFPEAYFVGLEKMNEKDYPAAIDHFQAVIDQGVHQREVYRSMAEAYLAQNEPNGILKSFAEMVKYHKLQSFDLQQVGCAYAQKKNYEQAIKYFTSSLYLDYQNPITLGLRGDGYLQLAEFEKALEDLELAVAYRPDYAKAYCNLGLAYTKLNFMERALVSLEKSLSLDDSDPFVFLHLGFFYEKKGEYQLALENFQKAKGLSIDHHGIDFYIETQKQNLY